MTSGTKIATTAAVTTIINRSDRTFETIADAEKYLIEQIDLACGDAIKYVADRGFTLIEVLVVIAMIGILSAIAAPSFLAFPNNTKSKSIDYR